MVWGQASLSGGELDNFVPMRWGVQVTKEQPLMWRQPGEPAAICADLSVAFRDRYAATPDGVWAAPGRINLIGEHTDYNGGLSLPLALLHRTYLAARRRDDGVLLSVASAQQDDSWQGRVQEIVAGDPSGWVAYLAGVVAVLAQRGDPEALGMDILVDGRVPLGAGLSSSAALSCAAAVAVNDLFPSLVEPGAAGLTDLVRVCVRAENEFAGAATGGMDQTISLRAQAGHALLFDSGSSQVEQVPWVLSGHQILVINTRVSHSLADGQYAARRSGCEETCGQ